MKTVKRIIAMLLMSVFLVGTLTGCGGEVEKHTCMKCNGSGKIRDEYGYYAYVKCTRCRGLGYLEY